MKKILIAAIMAGILSGCYAYTGSRTGYWQTMDALETRQTLKEIEANTFWNSINLNTIPDP